MNILAKLADFVKPSNTTSTGLKKGRPIGMSKLIYWVKLRQKDVFLVFCMVLISVISFNLGKIGALKKTPITIMSDQSQADVYSAVRDKNTAENPIKPKTVIDRRVVVSKNSDKYHFTWCSGAKRIKEENKIWFADEAAAQSAGYTKAGNCPDF